MITLTISNGYIIADTDVTALQFHINTLLGMDYVLVKFDRPAFVLPELLNDRNRDIAAADKTFHQDSSNPFSVFHIAPFTK